MLLTEGDVMVGFSIELYVSQRDDHNHAPDTIQLHLLNKVMC